MQLADAAYRAVHSHVRRMSCTCAPWPRPRDAAQRPVRAPDRIDGPVHGARTTIPFRSSGWPAGSRFFATGGRLVARPVMANMTNRAISALQKTAFHVHARCRPLCRLALVGCLTACVSGGAAEDDDVGTLSFNLVGQAPSGA